MAESTEHLVRSFDQELARLRGMLTEMGGIVENQIALATRAIMQGDNEAASAAVEADPRVDALDREAEQFAIRMIALRQPKADDLRHIVGSLKIAAELERVGDYAANVAKRSMVLNQYRLPFSLSGIGHLAQLVAQNLKIIVDAVTADDVAKARQVWLSDQPIDDLYNTIFRELLTYMMEDPRSITPCAHLLFIAKNLERMGDHATNIAEILHYAVTGEMLPVSRPKSDNSAYAVVREKDKP